jgi:hypothetical protein
MWNIEDMARKTSNLWGPNEVVAAWDGLILPVRQSESNINHIDRDVDLRREIPEDL